MIDAAGMRVMRAIGEHGSFTAAAAALGYSQPAVSQMVRRLEQRTGTALVDRVGRTVRLTEAGAVLARYAVGVLGALDAAEEEVAAIAGLRAGRVRLVAFPSASAALVPKALALVRDRFPKVAINFAEAEPPESLAALRDGTCDLAVAFTYTDDPAVTGAEAEDLVIRHLLDDDVLVALPPGHRLAADAGPVDLAELAEDQWIAGCPRCRGHLLQLSASVGFVPEVSFETEDYVAVQGMVAAGLGVALIPDLMLHTTANPQVVIRPVTPASRREIVAVTTPDLLRVPAVAAALDALVETAASPDLLPTFPPAPAMSGPEPEYAV